MITVNYLGGTGNCLTQYTYGRLLADYLEQSFYAEKIEMFPELETMAGGNDPVRYGTISISQTSKHDQVLTFDRMRQTTEGFDVVLNGYFEVGKFYYPYASIIRSWFKPAGETIPGVAVHVRGGDGEHNSPPTSYYIEALGQAGIGPDDQFYIVTDDPDCKVVKSLQYLKCSVLHDTPANDFTALRRHDKIIIGNSTFAWWAAFLFNASMVIQPEPLHGFRSKEMPNSYLKIPAWKQVEY